MTVRLQPYGKPVEHRRLTFDLPEELEPGDYRFVITDAPGYQSRFLSSHPYLLSTTTVDQLHGTMQRLLKMKRDSLYLMLQLKQKGIAVGRNEFSQLPSSRKAMLTSPTSTAAVRYTEARTKTVPSDYVTKGELSFTLHVRERANE